MELGGSRRPACIDALIAPFFWLPAANDRRTASADGYPSLIPFLPHSTTVEQPAAPFLPTPHSLAEVDIEETGTRRLEIDPHARDLRARLKLPVPELGYLLGPTPQSSDDTCIADLTTTHHHLIPIKHRSYPNTVNYYLDSTNYHLSKTKTIQLTQLDCSGLGEAEVGGVEVVVNSVGVGVVFNVDKVVVGSGEVCDVCVAALCTIY